MTLNIPVGAAQNLKVETGVHPKSTWGARCWDFLQEAIPAENPNPLYRTGYEIRSEGRDLGFYRMWAKPTCKLPGNLAMSVCIQEN